jgi:hypothetical protein
MLKTPSMFEMPPTPSVAELKRKDYGLLSRRA